MNPSAAAEGPDAATPSADLSLAPGGPMYALLLKAQLVQPPLGFLRRRTLALTALAWLPLLALTLADGTAVSGVTIPFLYDLEAYARFLIALPILMLAEVVAHRHLAVAVAQFRKSGLVTPDLAPRFEQAVGSAVRLRNSTMAELAFLAFAFVATPLAWHYAPSLPASTWYAGVADGRVELTRAGWWFLHASVPLSQFMILRLYFRLFVWSRLLWQVSRLPLHLMPAHPDRCGGLGFLEHGVWAFMPLMLAQAVTVCGFIASRVLFDGRDVLDFRIEVAVLVVVLLVLILLPLCWFTPRLIALRQMSLDKYGALAASYVRDFDHKWIDGRAPRDESLLGSADIQSLADLAGSFDIVRSMRPAPFGTRVVVQALAVIAVPFLPLIFTVYSLPELLSGLARMLL